MSKLIQGEKTHESCCVSFLWFARCFVIVGSPKGNQVIGPLGYVLKINLGAIGSSQKVFFFIAQSNRVDLSTLRDMIEAGKIKPVVKKIYPLAQVAEAMRHLGTGHAQGKIVLTMK